MKVYIRCLKIYNVTVDINLNLQKKGAWIKGYEIHKGG